MWTRKKILTIYINMKILFLIKLSSHMFVLPHIHCQSCSLLAQLCIPDFELLHKTVSSKSTPKVRGPCLVTLFLWNISSSWLVYTKTSCIRADHRVLDWNRTTYKLKNKGTALGTFKKQNIDVILVPLSPS